MKKVLITILLVLIYPNISYANDFFFKNCELSNAVTGNYIINLDKNVIEVELKRQDGLTQNFADKINVYGWDFYLDSSPEKMNYWQLFFNMYKYKHDFRSQNHFESAAINFYHGYQLSKLPNINIHGYMGQLNNHEKLIRRIEKVLFQ